MERKKIWAVVLGVWVMGVAAGAARGAPITSPAPLGGPVVRQDDEPAAGERISGEEALKRAYAIRKRSFGKEGEDKRSILLEAVAAYRTILTRHADEPRTAAAAALRAGDLCRGLGRLEEAFDLYGKAVAIPEAGESAARALLEIAHLLRRAERVEEAVQTYRDVGSRFPEEGNAVSQALLWVGKIEHERRNLDAARAAWTELVTRFDEPETRVVSAYDFLASSHIDEGNETRAREVLEECSRRFAERASGESRRARDLARALARMRSRARLSTGVGEESIPEDEEPEEPVPDPEG
jgi:tetratricopeptide (TPR) repeat protein